MKKSKYDLDNQFAQGDTLVTPLQVNLDNLEEEFQQVLKDFNGELAWLKPGTNGLKPVALGEAHGHAHVFKDDVDIAEVEAPNKAVRKFLVLVPKDTEYHHVQVRLNDMEWRKSKGIESAEVIDLYDYKRSVGLLKDDRHAPHKVPKGIYEVTTQMETDINGWIRPVVD